MNNFKLKAVVFDMDGLMIDTEPLYKYSFQKTAAGLGFDFEDSFFFRLVGRPDSSCKKMIRDYFGPKFPMEDFWSRWPVVWRSMAESDGIDQKNGLSELLAYLKEQNVPVAIATSSHRDQMSFSLRVSGLSHSFDAVVTGDEIAQGKPAPDIYLEAAKRLGVSPSSCVALEDSENGLISAWKAGMYTIMVPDLKVPSDEVRTMAHHVADSLHEVLNILEKHL